MSGANGYTPHQGYGGLEGQQLNANAYNSSAATSQVPYGHPPPASSSTPATTSSQQSEIPKDEVGWYFVEQYYTTLSRSPEKLYLFYNKRSQFVSGQETDKVAVCVGQRAINDRIKELDFQDCKVRVTNVDSQASDTNIVIQVIGEISNKSQAHKKFTQTFVLATQTNGYFVLNDIFRYLVEEEEETTEAEGAEVEAPAQSAQEEIQQAPAAESGYQEPAPTVEESAEPKTLTSSLDPSAVEHDAQAVDKELVEKVLKEPAKSEDEPAAAVNGVTEPEKDESNHVEEAPTTTTAELEEAAPTTDAGRPSIDESDIQPEKPKDPEPTPSASPPKQAPSQPVAPPKPAAPKTWASLAASAARVATPTVPSAPAPSSQPRPTPSSAQNAPKATTPTPAAAPSAPSTSTAPTASREEPAAASQDEWNTVGGNHNRQQSRQVNAQEQGPQNRAYVKNVYESVDGAELKARLEQFGEITYFDISRPKVSLAPQNLTPCLRVYSNADMICAQSCAFVDFKTAEGYNAAIAANPHTLGSDKLYVEERRFRQGAGPYTPRGGPYQGGRGGGGNRGGAGQGAPRGNFQGGGGGRGAGYTSRGGRGGSGASGPGRGRGGAGGGGASAA